MKDPNMRGFMAITKREFLSHTLSPRMVILVVIFSLIVLLSAFGLSTLGAMSLSSFVPENQTFLGGFVLDSDGDGAQDDLVVYARYENGTPIFNATVEALVGGQPYWMTTDHEGRAVLPNVTGSDVTLMVYYGADIASLAKSINTVALLDVEESRGSLVYMSPVRDFSQISLDTSSASELSKGAVDSSDDSSGTGITPGFYLMAVDQNGGPAAGRTVRIVGGNETLAGKTDSNGFHMRTDLDNGFYDVYTDSGSGPLPAGSVEVDFSNGRGIMDILKDKSPDEIIGEVSGFVMIIGTLSAIILAYDSIIRERQENSLDFLLCRPVRKWTILSAKFLGTLLALSVPFIVVNLVAVGIIRSVLGAFPSAVVVLVFLIGLVMLMSVWILLELALSTLSRTSGTAILGGIGLWFFYTFLWALLPFILGGGSLEGMDLGLTLKLAYFSPNDCFSYMMVYAQAQHAGYDSELAGIGFNGLSYVAVLIAWLAGTLVLAHWVFHKKIV